MAGLIPDTGKTILLRRAYGTSKSKVEKFRIGVGSTTPVADDTDLKNPVPTTPTTINTCDTPGDWSESTDAITPTANTTTYKQGYQTTDDTALNIGKSGTTESFVYYRDTVSLDLSTSGTYLYMWIYITDSTALAKISNAQIYIRQSSNYRYWETSSLSTGWNLLQTGDISSYDGQSATAPTLASIDTFELRINTTASSDTLSIGDVIMDYPHYDIYSNMAITFVTGFPVFYDSENKVESRVSIPSTRANGYQLTEIGEFNTDSTPLLFSRDTYTVVNKTNDIELNFILYHQITNP